MFLLALVPAGWIVILAVAFETGYNKQWFKILGEIITIPILAVAFVLLVMAIIKWWKEGFNFLSSLSFYTMLMIFLALAFLFTS
jgi:hypothetical protein